MAQTEVREHVRMIKPILFDCYAKVPVTKWDLGEDGEAHEITTVTLVVKDISDRDIRRLARTALSKIGIVVELSPTMEQTEFPDADDDDEG